MRSLSTVEPVGLLRFLGLLVSRIGIRVRHFRFLAQGPDDIALDEGHYWHNAERNENDVAVIMLEARYPV